MKQVCLYFQVHQPYRIKPYSFFDLGNDHQYFDGENNLEILNKVSEKCYLPANKMLLSLIENNPGKVHLSFSLSGVFLEQIRKYKPDVLASFKKLVDTGCVDILAETYYHSLSSVYSEKEFLFQVREHTALVEELFSVRPVFFRNTELIYNKRIARLSKEFGFQGILTEGSDDVLASCSPNQLYRQEEQHVFLRNYKRTDDIAFRFSDVNWVGYPLTPDGYLQSILDEKGSVVNLFMDYETIGEHHWEDTGIFEFWSNFIGLVVANKEIKFSSLSEISVSFEGKELALSNTISWADSERDLSAWVGNEMQEEAINRLYKLETRIKATNNERLLSIWRRLQTSDHFYYMSTKHYGDGAVHGYFSPFRSPYDAYIFYMNVLSDFELELEKIKA